MSNEALKDNELDEIEVLMAELEAEAKTAMGETIVTLPSNPEPAASKAVVEPKREVAPPEKQVAAPAPTPAAPKEEVAVPSAAVQKETSATPAVPSEQPKSAKDDPVKRDTNNVQVTANQTERRIIKDEAGNVIQGPAKLTKDPASKPAQLALQFYVDPEKFRAETSVSDARLDSCMIEQNGLRAFYGAQAARAEAQHSRLKVRFDVLEASLYDEHRKSLAASGEKVTEKMVETAVKIDPRWILMKNVVIEAESIANINKALAISLGDRRDMLIQLAADRRDEMKGQARLMEVEAAREELKDRALNAGSSAMKRAA